MEVSRIGENCGGRCVFYKPIFLFGKWPEWGMGNPMGR
jgi:hypothetical protein